MLARSPPRAYLRCCSAVVACCRSGARRGTTALACGRHALLQACTPAGPTFFPPPWTRPPMLDAVLAWVSGLLTAALQWCVSEAAEAEGPRWRRSMRCPTVLRARASPGRFRLHRRCKSSLLSHTRPFCRLVVRYAASYCTFAPEGGIAIRLGRTVSISVRRLVRRARRVCMPWLGGSHELSPQWHPTEARSRRD